MQPYSLTVSLWTHTHLWVFGMYASNSCILAQKLTVKASFLLIWPCLAVCLQFPAQLCGPQRHLSAKSVLWRVQRWWKFLPLCMPRWHCRVCALMTHQVQQKAAEAICMFWLNNDCVTVWVCVDQHIRLYDASRGRFHLKRTVKARDVGWSVLDVCFTPDSRSVLYSSWSDYSKTHTCTWWTHRETVRKIDIYKNT